MPPKVNLRKNKQGSSSDANAADSPASGAADEANPKPSTLRGFWMALDRRCVHHGPRYLTSSKHLFPSYKQLCKHMS